MNGDVNDYLSFRKLITPTIITIVFWILAILCVIYGLVGIIRGASGHYGGGNEVLRGIVTLVIGPILVRIWCELIIIAFKIYDVLVDIKKAGNTEKNPA